MTTFQCVAIVTVSFVFGFLLGYSLSTVLSLIFWGAAGCALVFAIDAAAGLGPRICALRAGIRGWLKRRRRSHLSVVVPFPQH